MAKSKPQKTLADYVAIAITPVLIMLLVGSLLYFLLEATYAGQYPGSLRWILFWYVIAIVLISRIGIEQGTAQASAYGLALAGATSLVILSRLDSHSMIAIALLGVAWWCANKLTWDCTLIDDSEDASGEGLLKSTGLESDRELELDDETPGKDTKSDSKKGDSDSETRSTSADRSWWDVLVGKSARRDGRPHAPGMWVVYFSLAALPLFGIGQLLIPSEKVKSRSYAFTLLFVYVASGLALLVTTSFLGLRRYLRQRRIQMPASITASWLGMGGGLILVIMLLCILLPRPNANYTIADLIDKVSNKVGKASHEALVGDEAGEGDGKRDGKSGEKTIADKGQKQGGKSGEENERGEGGGKKKPGGSQGEGKAKKGSGKKQGGNKAAKNNNRNSESRKQKNGQNDANNGDQKNGDQKENQNDDDQSNNGENGTPQSDSSESESEQSSDSKVPQISQSISNFVKWLIYGVLAIVILVLVIKNWQSILEGFLNFLRELRNMFSGWFTRKSKSASKKSNEETDGKFETAPRPYSSFSNPFHSGTAYQTAPRTVIAYTFEAFEAWAYERGIRRKWEQTPREFARDVCDAAPEISKHASQLATLYTRAAYAEGTPPSNCLETLETIWRAMDEQASSGRQPISSGETR
ncbi:MAG: hypothetical protein Tsb009_08250 [Planctomycetaceae bacterium]